MTDNATINELVEKSASTDVQVLLASKEKAKRLAMDDPSAANLAAFKNASQMLESAMTAVNALRGWKEALRYITEDLGRKCGKTKLFEDIKTARLKKQADGSFKLRDVERYAASLPMAGTPDTVAEKAADRQRRKEEADIRRAVAAADREEFDLAVKKGKFVPREQVHLELAARAVSLASGIKTAFEARSLDFVAAADGNPKKAASLVELLEAVFDEALNEYSREIEFDVAFTGEAEQSREALGG